MPFELLFIMKFSLFTLLLSVSASVRGEDQIVGGTAAQIQDFPYQVSLQYSTSHICGGSIIDHQHILTAAHCVNGRSPSQMGIRAGSTQRASGGKLIGVTKVTQHPNFDTQTFRNDIAVLQLSESLEFGPTISTVNLPSSSEEIPQPGVNCSVTGWGTLRQGEPALPSNLYVVSVNIVEHERCVKEYSEFLKVEDSMICAGVPGGGKDACQGDSGGPLVDQRTKKQVGIVTWGYGCGQPERPGVYTSTADFLAWIKGVI